MLQAPPATVKESMVWYGKVLGALLGAILGRGWLGAVIGFLIGHQFDRRMEAGRLGATDPQVLRAAFFRATFQVMGQVAKADGRVSEQEIEAARATMRRFALDEVEVRRAIAFFTDGKRPDFELRETLEELRGLIGHRGGLRRMFLQIQLEAALHGNGISPAARPVFHEICQALGVSALEFASLEAMLRMRAQAGAAGAETLSPGAAAARIADAYRVLSVQPSASNAELTRAYRRLMSRNHPDKLVANGLPESMVAAAHERTKQVLAAYELLKRHRGMK
jgi:DnaJ like chaperone protein